MNSLNRMVAQIFGVVLVLVGILGFIPGITTHADGKDYGYGGGAVLGIFGVNLLHNLVHLLTGAIFLWAGFANDGRNSRNVNIGLGVLYLLVAIVNFLPIDAINQLVNVGSNTSGIGLADPILHLLLGVVLLGVGFGVKDAPPMGSNRTTM